MIKINANRISNIKLVFGSALFAVMIIFTSCNNELHKTNEFKNQPVEMAKIKINVNSESGRSIMPSFDKTQLTDITIYGKWKSGSTVPDDYTPISNTFGEWQDFLDESPDAEIEVQTGLWDFKFDSKLNGISFAGEITDKEISAAPSADNSLTFSLSSDDRTAGINITIKVTQGDAKTVTAILYKDGSTVESKDLTLDSTTLTTTYTKTGLNPRTGEYSLEFQFKAQDGTVLNTWKGTIVLAYGITTTDTIEWATDKVYTINYYNTNGADFDGVKPETFTRKTQVTLPTMTKSNYVFDGWYKESTFQNRVTKIEKGTVGTQNLYAHFINIIYVKNGGEAYSETATGPNGTTNTSPLATIADAVSRIKSYVPDGATEDSNMQWRINVNGEVTGAQTIESITKVHAKKLTIEGGGTLNGNFTTAVSNGSTLTINTIVPVTLYNITITGGKTTGNGGGIAIISGEGTEVTLDSYAVITGNEAGFGGGICVSGAAQLIMNSSSEIKLNTAEYGGAICLGVANAKFKMEGGTIGDSSKNTPAESNARSNKATANGGAISGADGSEITLNGGTIAYNYADSFGGAISTSGTLLVKNSIKYNKAGSKGGGLSLLKPSSGTPNFTLDEGAYFVQNVAGGVGGAVVLLDASLSLNMKSKIYIPFEEANNNDIYLFYNPTTQEYAKINLSGALEKHSSCPNGTTVYATITPGSNKEKVILTESSNGLRSTYGEKLGINYDGVWSIRPSNGALLNGYEISSSTYADIMPSKIKNGGKNVKIIYIGTLTWTEFSGIAGKLQNATDNIYLDFSEAERSSEFTTITENVFFNRDKLVSIIFPNGITNLGTSLFGGCDGLTSVTLPNDLVSAGDYTFNNCLSLDAISLPSTLETIGVGAFKNTSITSIRIPATVTTIKSEAFAACDFLQSVDFLDTENRMWKIGSTTYDFSGYTASQFAEMLVNADELAQYQGTWTKVTE